MMIGSKYGLKLRLRWKPGGWQLQGRRLQRGQECGTGQTGFGERGEGGMMLPVPWRDKPEAPTQQE